jgi:hypothetical protein
MQLSESDKMPSPCIDICKEKRGRCIACGRDDDEIKAWKKAETYEEKLALITRCMQHTTEIGTRVFWEREYRKKCRKKGADCPLDDLAPLSPVGLRAAT